MHKMLHIPPAWIGSDEPPPAEPAKELPEIPIPAAVLADTAPPPKPAATIGCCCRTTPLGHLVISGTTIVVLGLILRVLYSLTQCHPAAGFFGAVNQSTWESLKLLLWPILFWWLFVAMGTTQLETKRLGGRPFYRDGLSYWDAEWPPANPSASDGSSTENDRYRNLY